MKWKLDVLGANRWKTHQRGGEARGDAGTQGTQCSFWGAWFTLSWEETVGCWKPASRFWLHKERNTFLKTFLEAFSLKYNVESSKTENYRYVEDKLWHEKKQMQVLDNPGSYRDLSFQYQRKRIKCNKTHEMISNTSNSNTIRHNQSVIQYSQSQRPAPWLKRQLCSPRSERPLLFCAWRQAEDAAPSVGQTSAERPFVSWRSCSSLLRTQIQKKYWKKQNKTSIDTLLSGRLK